MFGSSHSSGATDIERQRKSSLPARKTSGMRASPTWSICLLWLAALLSPIQALQGTPVLCHLVLACNWSNATPIEQPMCCSGGAKCVHVKRSTDSGAMSNRVAFERFASPVVPCPCPANCWCRQPEEPQVSPPHLLRLPTLTDVAIFTPCFIPSASVSRIDHAQRSEWAPASARQVCAVLCRFLA